MKRQIKVRWVARNVVYLIVREKLHTLLKIKTQHVNANHFERGNSIKKVVPLFCSDSNQIFPFA